jgi:hypothetical protein
MSYFDNINPKAAMESLGLRRADPGMMEMAVPVLAAFGLGLGVGAGIALLLAPKAGSELRGDIQQKAVEVRDNIQKSAANLQENVRKSLPKAEVETTGNNGSTTGSYRPSRAVTNS